MSDSNKTKEQLIEELKALRGQASAGTGDGADTSDATTGLTRREILSGWVAPVILTVPLVPRSGRAQSQGNDPDADVVGFPTRLNAQVDNPAGTTQFPTGFPTQSPTNFPTNVPTAFPTNFPTNVPTTSVPTQSPTSSPTQSPTAFPTQAPTQAPTQSPTQAPTQSPTFQPTAAPTVSIPVEVTEFDVNG